MEKDEIERRKLYISQDNIGKENFTGELKMTSSIYKIKNKENIDISNNKENLNKSLVKKIIHNSPDKKTFLNNYIIEKQSNSQKNSRNSSRDIKDKKSQTNINNRYQYFENDDISDKYDEFSEKSKPKEKPNINKYQYGNVKENLEEINQSSEIRRIMQRSTNKNIQASYIKEEQIQTDNALQYTQKTKKVIEIDFDKIYYPHKKDIEKNTFFIILFSIGILFSTITVVFCTYLQLYGNKDVYIILGALSLVIIGIYILGIKCFYKDRKKVLNIIDKKSDPEKINQSKSRKWIYLFIYLLIIASNYFYVIMLVNTSFLNNIKLSIRGKGYDINEWIEFFKEKNYNEILKMFEKYNIIFLIFGWLNWLLMIFILIYKIILIINYRLIKSIIQVLCIVLIQGGIFQIYLSIYCYKFRDVNSLEGVKLSWATPGTISNGAISIIIGFFGFYAFFVENKKRLLIFHIGCFIQIVLLFVFTGGLYAIGDKFYNYKKATCNSLFKFISEDYLLKNKINGCSSKYLSSADNLKNIICPKDRIMINWEKSEHIYKDNDNKINFNNEDSNKVYLGCINQSCCLQLYFEIKNKFDFLLILSIHQISYYLILFICGIYINVKINTILQEEIKEKKSIFVMFILTILIYITVIPFIINLPDESNQSLFNKIKNIDASEDSSIFPKYLTQTNQQNLFKYTNETFNSVKQNIKNNFKINVILYYLENKDYEYKLSYYEYTLSSYDLNIYPDNSKLGEINYYDYENYALTNLTKKIKFKSKTNLINDIFDYFNFIPYHPLKNKILLNLEINAIFVKRENNDEVETQNEIKDNYKKYISIAKEDIINNYNEINNKSIINIMKEEIDFSIMNKNELFYLRGNINNDNGNSLINVYNYNYNNEPIYSIKTNNNGSFIIGPLYKLIDIKQIYYLNIEISKIKINNITNNDNQQINEKKYMEDSNYCKYYDLIKINQFTFNSNDFYSLNNIDLPEYKIGTLSINGIVKKYEGEQDPINDVYVKLFYDNNINKVNEYIEDNQNNINTDFFDNLCLTKTTTDKEGKYSLNINKNGQYMIIFIKEEYYLEKHIFTINDIISKDKLEMGITQLISLFNSGKIVVKLEWKNKPPDLDLICRFQAAKDNYCYTFFGNKKCVETEYFLDSRQPNEISSEIIEINKFSKYIYLFYVRKYFDSTNGSTQNELKKDGVEIGPYINYTDIDINYNEYLNNSMANILVYTNGFKIPALKINVPGFIKNEDNTSEYIYWSAFCINGLEGISSLKVINQMMQNEPPKNICLSYYNQNNVITFSD